MKNYLFAIVLFAFVSSYSQKVTYNHLVDATNKDIKEVCQLFENYIISSNSKETKKQFWNTSEQEQFIHYDFLENEFQPSLYMGFPAHVLSITSQNDGYQIKVQYGYCKEDGTPYVLAIANYLAKKENGQFKLFNVLPYNRLNWNAQPIENILFYYPKYHPFDEIKASKLVEFASTLCNHFNVPFTPFEYYLANTYDEIQLLKGFDYAIGMGGNTVPSGKASEAKVYCGGLGEYYPHEVFHVLIDQFYPNKHFWVSEGIATFLGGSRGQTLEWHCKRTHAYLVEHPEINLNELLKLNNLDEQTAYHYVLGGLIAKKIYEKGGWPLLQQFMNSGKSDTEYYEAITKFLGVSQSNLNCFLRKELGKQH